MRPADHRCRWRWFLLLAGVLLGLSGCQALMPPPTLALAPPPPVTPPAVVPQPIAVPQGGTTGSGIHLISAAAVRDFYRGRQGAPAWQRPDRTVQLLTALRESAADGLIPADYHLRELEAFGQTPPHTQEEAVEHELLLTDAFLTLATHYRYGRLNLRHVLPEWQPQRRDQDLGALLENALAQGTIPETLQRLLPTAPAYRSLKTALTHYRALADQGGWPAIPSGNPMRQGDHGARIALLRQRLTASGDLAADAGNANDRFDAPLQAAVERFQSRHGLKVDGVVAQKTMAALNVPTTRRIQQLATNLERWRWLPRDLGRRHIEVNIAGFSLTVMEDEQPLLTMRVVAGRPDRPTPILNSAITYLVLNPTWEVPHEIATKDLLPKIRKDPAYLERLGFRVLAANGGNGQELDAALIDWQQVDPTTFRYRLSQKPGADNFLGQVKFIFPNPYSVYLHDTPAKELFKRESRPYSSGCVRAEKPLTLAALLLRGTPLDSEQALNDVLADGTTRTVHLPSPMPIHLLYQTAWVDDQGTMQFRPDLYGHDRLIEEGLRGRAIKKPLPCIGECGQ